MEPRRDTSHMSFNAASNTHLPGDFSGDTVTCRGCKFSGTRWEYLEHLDKLGYCWSCHGLGVFKFRAIEDNQYDRACSKCGGNGLRRAPLPPRPKETSHDLEGCSSTT